MLLSDMTEVFKTVFFHDIYYLKNNLINVTNISRNILNVGKVQ